jgi:uncharacterized Zn-finger protein
MRDPQMTGYAPHAKPGVTPEDRITVTSRAVHCDGATALGHPRVWLRIEGGEVTCPYCSRTYVLAEGAGDDGHH